MASGKDKEPAAPLNVWGPVVALAWLVPGGGHFLLKRYGRAGMLGFAITGMYLFGLMMRGYLFQPVRGPDVLSSLMNYGGFLGNVCAGLLYLLTVWLGYSQPEIPGAVHDYGAKFLVTAGLLNILAMVDAYEIAAGRKN
ncbi:MAG: DUF6677 family protein [Bryobacteraceae bacterium]